MRGGIAVGTRARMAVAGLMLAAVACRDASTGPAAPSGYTTDPAQAYFETADIEHFWDAIDAGGTAVAFEQWYLGRATSGLRDFMHRRDLTGQSMRAAIVAFPRWYASIRATTLSLRSDTNIVHRIRDNYVTMQGLYPDAVFVPVTFLIGRFSTGGTIGSAGILIGAEFYTRAPDSPIDELSLFQRNNVRPIDSLTYIVAHEHVHVLQVRGQGIMGHANKTLLEQAFLEGSADFLGELASGGNINAGLQAWAIPREDSLWTAFQAVMNSTNVSAWLYNQGTATVESPGDLGYFIGYRIAKAYYDAAADKKAAVKAIIEAKDAGAFVTASGYAP